MKTYKYTELPDHAKWKIREPYAKFMMDVWREPVFEDFKNVAKCLGFDVSTFEEKNELVYPVGKMKFEPEMVQKIRTYAKEDEELHQIAEGFLRVQSECKFRFDFFIEMNWVMDYKGIHIEWRLEGARQLRTILEADLEAFGYQFLPYVNRLIQWLNRQLQKEHEWITSEEAIEEYCEWNEMIFTEEGNLYVG